VRTLTRVINYESRADVFHYYPSPDIHLGNEACDEKALGVWVKAIQDDPFALWSGSGDFCEFINRKDKRFDEESIAPWLWGVGDLAKAQRDRAIDVLKPIAGKCIALLKGNHEDIIYQHEERDVYGPLVEAISQAAGGAKLALDYWGFVRLLFHRSTCKGAWALDIFMTHGWWGGRLQGNGALNLERLAGWVQAAIIVAGHDHKLKTLAQVVVRPTKSGGIEYVRQVCGSCGSFLDGAKYGEAAGYRPSPPGHLMITIEPDEHDAKITM
jgi:predicted phosphodiesterase